MDNNEPKPHLEKIRKELQRKSLDQILVFNPTDKDHVVVWDGFNHIIPAKAERTLPRYIAQKYFKEMVDFLIHSEESTKIDAANAKRLAKGNPPLNPQEREQFALQYGLHTANEPKRKELLKTLFLGVAEEYGVGIAPKGTAPKKKDDRPTDDKLLEELEVSTPKIKGKIGDSKIEDKIAVEAKKIELLEKTKGENDTRSNTKTK